jgi:hypothetical protein
MSRKVPEKVFWAETKVFAEIALDRPLDFRVDKVKDAKLLEFVADRGMSF